MLLKYEKFGVYSPTQAKLERKPSGTRAFSSFPFLSFFLEVQAGHGQRARAGAVLAVLSLPLSSSRRNQKRLLEVMGRKLVDQVVFAKK